MIRISDIAAGKREVRNFGILFALVGLLLTAWSLYTGSGWWVWSAAAGALFLLAGFLAYPLLKPVYIGWMIFAFALGWVNTRVILGLFFYLVITPVGLVMRLFGRDPMHRKFDRGASTYWVRRPSGDTDRDRYENLF